LEKTVICRCKGKKITKDRKTDYKPQKFLSCCDILPNFAETINKKGRGKD